MVGEEVVQQSCHFNSLRKGAGKMDALTSNGNFEQRPHPEDLRRDLIALRVKHGAASPVGCRCSNIIELIQAPEVPRVFLERQMADLQRLLA
jgi:hypothetical protein